MKLMPQEVEVWYLIPALRRELSKIIYYMKPNAKKNSNSWKEVPEDIKNTYEKLGIPQAEINALGGVGAQYESEIVYHNLKKELESQGIIFFANFLILSISFLENFNSSPLFELRYWETALSVIPRILEACFWLNLKSEIKNFVNSRLKAGIKYQISSS